MNRKKFKKSLFYLMGVLILVVIVVLKNSIIDIYEDIAIRNQQKVEYEDGYVDEGDSKSLGERETGSVSGEDLSEHFNTSTEYISDEEVVDKYEDLIEDDALEDSIIEQGQELDNKEGTLPLDTISASIDDDLYWKVVGNNILDENGELVRIKGMSFGNNVWFNPSTPPYVHHDEESYKELNELGFNSVRFYINYQLFEDDANPFEYKEEGFKWLDENIEWADKHDIKLIINMHVPQGGFISPKNVEFWSDSSLQERYHSLFEEIARRYNDEPAIAGYGLINEPYLPDYGDASIALNQYYEVLEESIRRIRLIDAKHIMFVERPYGTVNSSTGHVSYPWGDVGSFRTVSDTNTVYEYHFYDAYAYNSQLVSYVSTFREWVYEDPYRVIMSGERTRLPDYYLSHQYFDSEDWVELVSENIEMEGGANAGFWFLEFDNENDDNEVFIDSVSIEAYNASGVLVDEIYSYDFDKITYVDGWDKDTGGGGVYQYSKEQGHPEKGSASIIGFDADYRMYISYNSNNIFKVQDGYSYKMKVSVKTKYPLQLSMGFQLYDVEKLYLMNKEYIQHKLMQFFDWGIAENVPMYLGEVGISRKMLGSELAGENWLKDVFTILNDHKAHYNYHDYHEQNYGYYIEDGREKRNTRSEMLHEIFLEYVNQ